MYEDKPRARPAIENLQRSAKTAEIRKAEVQITFPDPVIAVSPAAKEPVRGKEGKVPEAGTGGRDIR